MLKNEIILSIVIPTRNRPNSLPFSVKSALAVIEGIPGEVIIVSNGETLESDIEQLEESLKSNCRIIRSETRLSLSQNWAFGFRAAQGLWITLLGDDDIIAFTDIERLENVLKDSHESGIRFRSGSFKWIHDGEYMPQSFVCPKVSNKISSIKTPSDTTAWWQLEPRKFPSGAGSSMIRKEWVQELDSKKLLFEAFSPDWFTASLYIYTFASYLEVDEIWAYLGDHPQSAMSQQKNPNGVQAQSELKLNPYQPFSILNHIDAIYPTTWLARMDSLIRAREIRDLDIKVPERELIREALRTTPRYIFKVRVKLLKQYFSQKNFINLISLVYLPTSIWKTLVRKIKLRWNYGLIRKADIWDLPEGKRPISETRGG